MTTKVVVDSCVAVKWFLREPDAAMAINLLVPDVEAIAPDFVILEIANVLWKNWRLKRIGVELIDPALASAAAYFDELVPTTHLIAEAAELARAIDHPVYDCIYVVAARRASARLVTTDKKLLRKLARTADAALAVDLAKWAP